MHDSEAAARGVHTQAVAIGLVAVAAVGEGDLLGHGYGIGGHDVEGGRHAQRHNWDMIRGGVFARKTYSQTVEMFTERTVFTLRHVAE